MQRILSSGLLGKLVFHQFKINCHLQNIRNFYSCKDRTKMYSFILSDFFFKNLLFFIILNCDVIPNNLTLIPTYDSSMLYIQVLLSKIKFNIKKYIIIPIYAKKEKKGQESTSEHTLMRTPELKNGSQNQIIHLIRNLTNLLPFDENYQKYLKAFLKISFGIRFS